MLADVENPEDPGAAAFDENAADTVTRPSTADAVGDEATALLESTGTEPRRINNSPPLSTRTHHSDDCNNNHIITVTDLDEYVGESLHDKVDDLIKKHAVVMFGNARQSIFSTDAKELLGSKIGVDVHSIDLDVHPKGGEIFQCVALQNNNKNVSTLPLIYIKGKFVGGYEDIKALHAKGQLESVFLKGLIAPSSAESTSPRQRQERLEASHVVPNMEPSRRAIMNPPFWFPNTVNHYVMRGVGFQVLVLSVLSVAFHFKPWGYAFYFTTSMPNCLCG
jgi:glutaredoxin 3